MDSLGKAFGTIGRADEATAAAAGRPTRDSMFLGARLSVAGGPAADVRVRNLSERGLMVELTEPLPVGTVVVLELRGVGEVSGRIAWQAEGRAGVALDREIDPTRARRRVGTRAR